MPFDFPKGTRTRAAEAPLAAAGFFKESEFDIDALEQQLRQEAVSRNASVPGPTMVGCFARKP
jgi:hypothetical protein